jgi:hypothetical protein
LRVLDLVSFGLLSLHQRLVTFGICEALSVLESFCEDFAFFDMVTFGLFEFRSFGLGEFWTFEPW